MFKQVVPILSLILLAGPVFAADSPPADQPAKTSTAKKAHHSGKHHKSTKSTEASAPK